MRQDGQVTTTQPIPIEPWLREILRCPQCGGVLRDGQHEDTPELQCTTCPLAYRVDGGIPVLLIDEARTREQ